MIISLINTISSLTRKGVSVVRENLQMWLGFEKSEVIGSEEVVNGDFATDSDWTEGTGWDIDVVNNKATCDGTQTGRSSLFQTGVLQQGIQYQFEFTLKDVTSGNVRLRNGVGASDIYISDKSLNDTYIVVTQVITSNATLVVDADENFIGSITNVSVKELTQITPDKSGNNNVGKLFTGKALSFDGVNDYVDCDGFTMSGDTATFAFWMNSNDTIGRMYSASPVRIIISYDSSQLSIHTGAWHNFGAVTAGEYHRVVVTINGTTAKCFVDGVQLGVDKTITPIDLSSATTNKIGSSYNGVAPFFNGKLSDFQIYNTDWTQTDVTFDYNNPNHLVTDNPNSTITLANLKGYWALSEGDGLVAYDSSGEGNNGTINGATYTPAQDTIPQLGMMDWAKSTPVADEITLIQAPNNKGYDILGNSLRLREHAFNLDASGYAEIADSDSLDFGTGDFTIEAWVKYKFENTGSGLNVIMSNGLASSSGTLGYNLLTNSSDFLVRLGNGTDVYTKNITGTPIEDTWYYIAFTREGTLLTIYVNDLDGVEYTDADIAVNVTTSSSVLIGRDTQSDRFYKDLIDEPKLYNRALTQKEITQNYKAGINKHKVGSSFSDDFSSDYGF